MPTQYELPNLQDPSPGSPEFEEQRAKLVADLSGLPNLDEVSIICCCGEHNLTPRQMIEEIRKGTLDGNSWVATSFKVDRNLAAQVQSGRIARLRQGIRGAIERLRNLDW